MSKSTLAIDGGQATFPNGPPTWPIPDDDVLAALTQAYADGSWGRYHGPHCEQLKTRLAEMHDDSYVHLCSSGTVAVELALRGLKIQPDDEVILAAYDFPGNFRSIEIVGARPVLVDIDPDTWCLDANAFDAAIGPDTRAIIVSHLHGGIADMRHICEIAKSRGLAVVEDACQVPGAIVDGQIAGTWGDVGILSFGGSKLLTAGRGGAVLTKDASVLQRVKIFCDRGNDSFPLSELQAAVLNPQLEKLKQHNTTRRENVARLWELCGSAKGLRPLNNHVADSTPSFYKLAYLVEPDLLSRDRFVAAIQAEGVAMDSGFRGFANRPQTRCRHGGRLCRSQQTASQTVLLHHPVLLQDETTMEHVAAAIAKVLTALVDFRQ